ncbi:MAG: glycosyltransferase family 2 protein [Candidatus Bathyarchaeota archaeon]
MITKPYVVACIPAYNEEITIAEVHLRACKFADRVIVCNDGSTDSTGEILGKLDIGVTNHFERMGKGVALKTLLRVVKDTKADIIVTLDADGTHLPEEIPLLIKPLLESDPELDPDMVVGSRFMTSDRGVTSAMNYVGNRIFNTLTFMLTGKRLTDTQSGFRAFKKKLLDDIVVTSKGYEVESEITIKTLRHGYKIAEVPIKCGKSYRAPRLNRFRDGFKIFTTIISTFVKSIR